MTRPRDNQIAIKCLLTFKEHGSRGIEYLEKISFFCRSIFMEILEINHFLLKFDEIDSEFLRHKLTKN